VRSLILAISSLLLFLGGMAPLLAQHRSDDTMAVTLDEVQVTALRLTAQQSEQPRAVQVLTRALMTEAGAVSLDDALRLSAVVDVRRRGPLGAQSDIGMRGSTFGQNLILIDGMRANDPQTGHHALALALPTEEIERVEIVPGHMSALHGADAFGGTCASPAVLSDGPTRA
jgi:iron complex outermembrane receptor protein